MLNATESLSLARYISAQVINFFPEGSEDENFELILAALPSASERIRPILASVTLFQPNVFNKFHSLQYATYLYLLANEIWNSNGDIELASKLFFLNKALNSIDLFYKIKMPEVFFLSHTAGTVLGDASYQSNLIVFHNVTVGRVGDSIPKISENVILFPGSIITGNTVIGRNSIVAAGVVLSNATIPEDTIVFGGGEKLIFKPRRKNYIELYLRVKRHL
jgi:serine O-acetyltransferase